MPAFRGKRVTRLQVKHDIDRLMDIFPKVQVRITRFVGKYSDIGEQKADSKLLLYGGEALVRPATGETEGYGLGTVENMQLVILVNGTYDIQQGDIVYVNDGREYEVEFPPKHFDAFTELRLGQRSQVTRPV